MEFTHALPPKIEQALQRGWVVITANQRAARSLRYAFDLRQQALGLGAWEPPAILAWESWTISLWNRLLVDGRVPDPLRPPLLLSPAQEHTIWRAIIAADASTASLQPVDALADTAANAWKLLHDYRGRARFASFLGNTDTRAFARWVKEFERHCSRAHYLTQAQLPGTLGDAIAHNHLGLWPGYLLVGFDSTTPAQSALLDTIRATGTPVEEHIPSRSTSTRHLISMADEHTELISCASWLRTRLSEQPHARIAVIVPALDTVRADIDRSFRQHLAPELNDIAAPTGSAPYEFSLGIPLSHTSLAAAALEILRWISGPIAIERVSALLLSPYFATERLGPAEHLARAEFDAFVLRRQHLLYPSLSIEALRNLVSHAKHASRLPTLLTHLRSLCNYKDSSHRTHAGWATTFQDLLEAAGWAPPAHLDSTEFQCRRKWDEALDELVTLDFDSPSDGVHITFTEALAAIERIASESLFAPESRYAPIQIMGPLESAGSEFDAIWFLHANDLDWPVPASPNPLLPWLLQRESAMPGADPVQDTARAHRTTQRIAASTPTIVFSYASESGDGRRRPSPILGGLALESRGLADLIQPPPELAPIELEAYPDSDAIPSPPVQVHPGGASILQLQAACGFRAFAEKRLYSTALESIALGLDPRERGSLVHSVLEDFWAHVESQSTLRSMTSSERDAQLARSIDFALSRHLAHAGAGWPRAYLAIEHRRLLRLLRPWLDYEANQRTPFVVQSRETELPDVRIGPLRLDIRVDRVDRVLASDGDDLSGEVILDYKTGRAEPADWLGPRPDAPQLPLYAVVSSPDNLAAIAYASVRPGKDLGMHGYQAHPGILPKPAKLQASSLAAQVEDWSAILTSLAEDFHAGKADVAPKKGLVTCQYCEQRLLCRLDPSTLDLDPIDDPDLDSDQFDPFALPEPEGFSG